MKTHRAKVSRLRQYLKLNRKRYTIERDRLLEAIELMPPRFTLLELIDFAKSRGYIHAASTIYRNFCAFVEAGILTELRSTGGKIEYERNEGDALYRHCIGCGKIEKFPMPRDLSPALDGFQKITASVHLRGFCSECQKSLKSKRSN